MKVLQLSKFYPPELGGIETAAFELTEGLNAMGIATEVLCAHVMGRSVEDCLHGYRVVRTASWGQLLSTSMTPAMVPRLAAERGRHDVLHVHLPNPMANLALWLVGWPGKVVLHWHSDIIHQERALKLYQPLQTWMLQRADAIVTTSPPYGAHSPWLRPWLSKVISIPLGISPDRQLLDPHEMSEAERSLKARHGDRPVVFSVGRMASYKGFEHLIEAARSLPKDVQVVIGGGGELLESHRQHIRDAGLQDRVFMPGRLSDAELGAYMRHARVFCMPSVNRAEAFGMVLLEAMAAGLPIVAADIVGSGVPWVNVHGQTGLNVAPGDAAALAEALTQLLTDPTRASAMGKAGRTRLESRFTARRMVAETATLYRRLLEDEFRASFPAPLSSG